MGIVGKTTYELLSLTSDYMSYGSEKYLKLETQLNALKKELQQCTQKWENIQAELDGN